MHRHGYKGTKFGRERDQREALVKSLAEALIINGSIVTTLPKAKTVVPYVERLITKAKKGDLHNRRQVIAGLQTLESAHKLVDELAPVWRDSRLVYQCQPDKSEQSNFGKQVQVQLRVHMLDLVFYHQHMQ
jgi:large subunit ribosomal protein L17